jgi:hypothetical protein
VTDSLHPIPFTTLVRWYLYDLEVVHPNKIAEILGLNPISQEGEEKEIEDSDNRMSELVSLLPFIDNISEINAQVLVAVQRPSTEILVNGSNGTLNLEEMEENLRNTFRHISFSAITAAISAGMELAILDHGGADFEEYEIEELDEQ